MVTPVAQVITVHADGSISGLQRKRGEGVDLTIFGRAEIHRASEIVWSITAQSWYIQLLEAPFMTRRLTESLWTQMCLPSPPDGCVVCGTDSDLLFKSYEDAVRAEIRFLNAARLSGKLPQEMCG